MGKGGKYIAARKKRSGKLLMTIAAIQQSRAGSGVSV